MPVPRFLKKELRALLRAFPAVALLGPRQCGKTTLARGLGGLYFDLEQPLERQRLDLEWPSAPGARGLTVLDEAQAHPGVFARLRGVIDERPRARGRFLLLGSVAPSLSRRVSESLAGRIAYCELSPFLLGEDKRMGLDRLWLHGGFPGGAALSRRAFPLWHRQYLLSLCARDLPLWGMKASEPQARRFLELLAAGQGRIWNASELGRSMGLSYHTVDGWLDYLEGAFLVRRLPAYSANLGKRLVRSPRIYVRDSGLLHALAQIPGLDALYRSTLSGASWEGFCVEQILSRLTAQGREFRASYFRTSDGRELDLVLETGRRLWALEIKLSASPAGQDFDRLNEIADLVKAQGRILVSRVKESLGGKDRWIANLESTIRILLEG